MDVQERRVIFSEDVHSSGRKHVRISDAESGEVVAAYWEETRSKPSGRPPRRSEAEFLKVYRTNWVDICKNRRLTFTEAGVLMHLLAFVGWESNFLVHPKSGENLSESELAELLGCDRSTLHTSLKALTNKGVISTVRRGDGRPNHYLFNSHIAFFGKYMKDIHEHEVFNDVEYKPVTYIKYREPEPKS